MSVEKSPLSTADIDRHIMQSYFHLADSIANLLGEYCEVVVHELGELSASLVKIVNGFHTGRSVGAPITDKALKILKNYQKDPAQLEQSYYSTTNAGHLVKSTTHIILGAAGKPIGLFCINLNLSYPLDKIMTSLLPQQILSAPPSDETFVSNRQEMMEYALKKAIENTELHYTSQQKHYKKAIISHLYENGFFELKDAVIFVAEKLHLTKYAIYKHLRELKGE